MSSQSLTIQSGALAVAKRLGRFVYFVVKKVLMMLPVLWFVVTLTFFLMKLAPGGPFTSEKNMSPEIQAELNKFYKLDLPIFDQYVDYLTKVVQGDLGPSFAQAGWTVNELIAEGFPVSAELGFYALIFALLIGMTAGVVASLSPNSWKDYTVMSFAMVGICVPTILLGPLLVLAFSIGLGIFPVSGWYGFDSKVLPALTLGAAYAAYIARLSRGGMLEVLSQDFIVTARAKGLREGVVNLKHSLKGGLTSVISFLGPATAGLLSGSFVVETVFGINGLGTQFVKSAQNRDYTMIMGTTVFFSLLILFFNLLSDSLLFLMDPRLKAGKK